MRQNEIVLMQTWCEEVTWISYETFNPLRTLRPDEQNQQPAIGKMFPIAGWCWRGTSVEQPLHQLQHSVSGKQIYEGWIKHTFWLLKYEFLVQSIIKTPKIVLSFSVSAIVTLSKPSSCRFLRLVQSSFLPNALYFYPENSTWVT